MKNQILISFIFLICLSQSKAQFIYPNDECAGALPIPVSTTGQLSDSAYQRNVYAAPFASSIANCGGGTNVYNDLWYRFTANNTSIAVVPENYSGLYQLFSGGCGSLASITCNPNTATFPPLTGLTIGQQYYLRTFYSSALTISTNNGSNYKLTLISPPSNDDCSGATLLIANNSNGIPGSTSRFTNQLATASSSSCNVAGNNINDVWYKFVASSVTHSVFVECVAGVDVYCYSGTSGSFNLIGNYSTGGSTPQGVIQLNNLTVGQTYYIRAGASSTVNFKLLLYAGEPANNDCANADTVLMSAGQNCEHTFTLQRIGATNSTTPCSNQIDKDVWYVFQAISTDVAITTNGDGASVRMELLDGSCGSLSCLAYSSNGQLFYSGLTVGNYYYLQMGRQSQENQLTAVCIGTYQLNDECSGAVTILMQPYNNLLGNFGNNSLATQSLPSCTGSSIEDVWYKFTATDTACIVTTSTDGSNPRFDVFSGTCTSLNSIYCSTSGIGRVGGLVSGNTYYIRFYNNTSVNGLFSIDVTKVPANDDCSGATLLNPQTTLTYDFYKNGLQNATQSLAPCTTVTGTADVWYKFSATQNSVAVITHMALGNGNPVTGIEVFSGTCASLNSILCFTQSANTHEARTLTNLTAGQTYYVRHSGSSFINSVTVIAPPSNDNISGAIKLTATPSGVQTLPSYSLHGASKQFNKICTSGTTVPYHDVWFYFIASATSHTISINSNNTFWDEQNTGLTYRIEAFDGYAPDSTMLASKLISCAANTLSLSGLTVNDTVYVRVYNTSAAGLTSIFGINVSNNQNIDDATNAMLLNLTNDYQFAINTTGATQSLPASGCLINDYPDDDVWFKFTASANTKRIIAGYETNDITLQLFSGSPASLNAVKCSNNIMVLPNNLTNGTTYYVRAYSKANTVVSNFRIGLFGEADPIANNCAPNNCIGTNLVANPRCESEYAYLLPKNDKGQNNFVTGVKLAEGWWSSNYATSDVWNADYPNQEFGNIPGNAGDSRSTIPRSGKGMLGMLYFSGWSEYVTGRLTQPLVPGKNYIVSFNVIMSTDRSNPVCTQIGAYLGNDSIVGQANNNLEFTPHVANATNDIVTETKTWKNICGILHADQAYQYITIGNFGARNIFGSTVSAATSYSTYFFIDDVVVAEAPCATTDVPEIHLKNNDAIKLHAFPNPAKEFVNISWNANLESDAYLTVTDVTGREVKRNDISDSATHTLQIETRLLSNGFYHVAISSGHKLATAKFIINR